MAKTRKKSNNMDTELEKITFAGRISAKNIPIPPEKEYLKCLVAMIESFMHRIKWRAYFKLGYDKAEKNEEEEEKEEEKSCEGDESDDEELLEETKETFGFKSGKKPPPIKELASFEKDVLDIVKKITFRSHANKFQGELRKNIKEMKETKSIIIGADKSPNFYKVGHEEYEKILAENVTKEYKKESEEGLKRTNMKTAEIAKSLDLDDRMQQHTMTQCYVTLKDHKRNFMSTKPCRLINPAKTDIGRVSKIILQEINEEVRMKTKLMQWRSTQEVLKWFKELKLDQKSNYKFLKFDVEAFYPSITKNLLLNALKYVRNITTVTSRDVEIVLQAREAYLFHKGEPWSKKNNQEKFDVPMGSYDGAEVCEVVGLYLLAKLTEKDAPFENMENKVGLYRDDGLAVIRGSGRTTEKLIQQIRKIFGENDLKITIEANIHETDFLDIRMNLKTREHKPFKKENSNPLYINVGSNHPNTIIKQIPSMVERRLSDLSSNKKIFDEEKIDYEKALKEAGHRHNLEYKNHEKKKKKKKRTKDPIYFNPPFSLNVKTNVGAVFLRIVDKHFPKKSKLHKYFNRSKIKVSYRTMPNIRNHISKHNAKISRDKDSKKNQEKEKRFRNGMKNCNCRNPQDCPLSGECQQESVVYQAKVLVPEINEVKFYYGMTGNTFKTRYAAHKNSFKYEKKESTTLSSYVWKQKKAGRNYEIEWSIKAKAYTYSSGSKQCDLCLSEKLVILLADQDTMLNKRDEILNKCPHRRKYCLKTLK